MGCAGSRLDDLEAVALCRDRSRLLADAIAHRYALAEAHAAYARSLRSVGESLHRFLDGIQNLPPPPSPVLQLPGQRKKGEPFVPPTPSPPPPAAIPGGHGHSDSGHIAFSDSDSDGEDDEHDFHLHSDESSPVHHHEGPTVNYARSHPPANSVAFEQRPQSPERVHFVGGGGGGDQPSSSSSSSAYPYYGYTYPTQNNDFYSYSSNSNPYPYYSGYGAEMGGGFFGSSSSPPRVVPPAMSAAARGGGGGSPSSRAPPPPPSPPRTSTWDFLNPFESYDSYYAPYTPSRSSKEVREEEGIPDLEDEEHEVVKEAYGDTRFVASSSGSIPVEHSGKAAAVPEAKKEEPQEMPSKVDDVVDKNVVGGEVNRAEEQRQNVAAFSGPARRFQSVSEVVQEIKSQFDRASESAGEVAKMLEVGKRPYHRKNSVYKVPSKMISVVALPSTSKDEFLEFEEDKAMGSGNLSSTLQKLYNWEKKLHDEVREEEKMRLLHDRKCKKLKRLDERGAEAYKVDSTQVLIKKLSTKITIAIQVVDSISKKISKLRDEELWPQINELIQGLVRMWRTMLECHRRQCQALSEAKNLDSIASGGKISDAHMEATKQLELELLDWISSFSTWIDAQKKCVGALNGWLLVGLRYEDEETADGIAPFSPGRLGAPPVFVICHQWSQVINIISEREVVNAMQAFASNVLHLWEQHNFEQRQRLMANKDMDRTLRIMEREEQEMRRAVENKKLVQFSGQNGHTADPSSLQLSLGQIFEAMQSFTELSMKAYEELQIRSEEERLARENSKVS